MVVASVLKNRLHLHLLSCSFAFICFCACFSFGEGAALLFSAHFKGKGFLKVHMELQSVILWNSKAWRMTVVFEMFNSFNTLGAGCLAGQSVAYILPKQFRAEINLSEL